VKNGHKTGLFAKNGPKPGFFLEKVQKSGFLEIGLGLGKGGFSDI
jgi:hypothetical protein